MGRTCSTGAPPTTFLYVGAHTDVQALSHLRCSETNVIYIDPLTYLKNGDRISEFQRLYRPLNNEHRGDPEHYMTSRVFDALFECTENQKQFISRAAVSQRFPGYGTDCSGGPLTVAHLHTLRSGLMRALQEMPARQVNCAGIRRSGLADLRGLHSRLHRSTRISGALAHT